MSQYDYEEHFSKMSDAELDEVAHTIAPKLKIAQELPDSPFKRNLKQYRADLNFEIWERTIIDAMYRDGYYD